MTMLKATLEGVVAMTPEEEAEHLASLAPRPAPVPQRVTVRQAKLALFMAVDAAHGNKLVAVEAALDSLAEPQRSIALIEWREATEVARDWPLVIMMSPIIGTDDEVDALFRVAEGL